MIELQFEIVDGAAPEAVRVPVEVDEILLAGYTGRDRAAVQQHIDELQTLGIAPPPRVPMVYVVPPSLATMDGCIEVHSRHTSGEVELFVVQTTAGLLVGVGSDHTDRHQEAIDVARSKQACPKVLSRRVWRHADVADHWDHIEISSWVTSEGTRTRYQGGTLGAFLSVDDLLREVHRAGYSNLEGRLIFGGTLAVTGRFIYGERFECRLHDPVLDRSLGCEYAIAVAPE
jgi:hypothetical protein